jgi:hypothetical protein
MGSMRASVQEVALADTPIPAFPRDAGEGVSLRCAKFHLFSGIHPQISAFRRNYLDSGASPPKLHSLRTPD